MFTSIFFTVIMMIPVYGTLLWTYFYPEESVLFGKRWMYKEEPEVSDSAITYAKFASLTTMIGLPIVIMSFILEIQVLKFSIVLFPVVIVIGAFKIFTDTSE